MSLLRKQAMLREKAILRASSAASRSQIERRSISRNLASPRTQTGNTDAVAKEQLKLNVEVERMARGWLVGVLVAGGEGETAETLSSGDLVDHLQNGVVLCKVINIIYPRSVKRIYTGRIPFLYRDNIAQYLDAIRQRPFSLQNTFDTNDLYEKASVSTVHNHIHALARVVQKLSLAGKLQAAIPAMEVEQRARTHSLFSQSLRGQSGSAMSVLSEKLDRHGQATGVFNLGALFWQCFLNQRDFRGSVENFSRTASENDIQEAFSSAEKLFTIEEATDVFDALRVPTKSQKISSIGASIHTSLESFESADEQSAVDVRLDVLCDSADSLPSYVTANALLDTALSVSQAVAVPAAFAASSFSFIVGEAKDTVPEHTLYGQKQTRNRRVANDVPLKLRPYFPFLHAPPLALIAVNSDKTVGTVTQVPVISVGISANPELPISQRRKTSSDARLKRQQSLDLESTQHAWSLRDYSNADHPLQNEEPRLSIVTSAALPEEEFEAHDLDSRASSGRDRGSLAGHSEEKSENSDISCSDGESNPDNSSGTDDNNHYEVYGVDTGNPLAIANGATPGVPVFGDVGKELDTFSLSHSHESSSPGNSSAELPDFGDLDNLNFGALDNLDFGDFASDRGIDFPEISDCGQSPSDSTRDEKSSSHSHTSTENSNFGDLDGLDFDNSTSESHESLQLSNCSSEIPDFGDLQGLEFGEIGGLPGLTFGSHESLTLSNDSSATPDYGDLQDEFGELGGLPGFGNPRSGVAQPFDLGISDALDSLLKLHDSSDESGKSSTFGDLVQGRVQFEGSSYGKMYEQVSYASVPAARAPWTPGAPVARGVGAHAELNKRGLRKAKKPIQQEDRHVFFERFLECTHLSLIVVLDGHAGFECAETARAEFPRIFEEELRVAIDVMEGPIVPAHLPGDFSKVFAAAFARIDSESLAEYEYEGATATVCIVWEAEGRRLLQSANVGDSTAVICKVSGIGSALSVDHKATSVAEKERIRAAGIQISESATRIGGMGVARALGDHFLKEQGIGFVGTPYICDPVELSEDKQALVVATDGLWDVVGFDQAAQIALRKWGTPEAAAFELVQNAVGIAQNHDNTSVVVVNF